MINGDGDDIDQGNRSGFLTFANSPYILLPSVYGFFFGFPIEL